MYVILIQSQHNTFFQNKQGKLFQNCMLVYILEIAVFSLQYGEIFIVFPTYLSYNIFRHLCRKMKTEERET